MQVVGIWGKGSGNLAIIQWENTSAYDEYSQKNTQTLDTSQTNYCEVNATHSAHGPCSWNPIFKFIYQ